MPHRVTPVTYQASLDECLLAIQDCRKALDQAEQMVIEAGVAGTFAALAGQEPLAGWQREVLHAIHGCMMRIGKAAAKVRKSHSEQSVTAGGEQDAGGADVRAPSG